MIAAEPRVQPSTLLSVLRHARGLSQADIAIAVGRSQATIARVERAVERPGPELAARLASLFGYSIAKLLTPIAVCGATFVDVGREEVQHV